MKKKIENEWFVFGLNDSFSSLSLSRCVYVCVYLHVAWDHYKNERFTDFHFNSLREQIQATETTVRHKFLFLFFFFAFFSLITQ